MATCLFQILVKSAKFEPNRTNFIFDSLKMSNIEFVPSGSIIIKSMYFPEDLKNTSLTYMIYQVAMPLHHGMYIQYKDLCWRSLHSNHLHHSYTLLCWLHRHKTHLQSMLEEQHNSDLQSRCIRSNVVY